MYAIDVPTVAGSLPTPAAAGTAGFFTDGNPGTGTPATIVPADFLNMVMQELINVANEGTAPLSKTSYTQVRDAISNMIATAGVGGGSGTVTNVTGVAPIISSGGAAPAISIAAATNSAPGSMSAADKTKLDGIAAGATANAGTVTAVTVASANGVSATVANQGTTPALTIALGAITPTSISCSGTTSAGSFSTSGTITGGAITCTTVNATGSDRRLKRNIRKADPRPLHRLIPYISFERKADGSYGRGAPAQAVRKVEPAYVVTFKVGKAARLAVDYQSLAYEQAVWAGRELDRQAKIIDKQAKLIAKLAARLTKLERRA